MDKYFTPSIEDIRVGYECEVSDMGVEPKWTKYIVSHSAINHENPTIIPSRLVDLIENYHPERVRVPYLTKEQIEAEGWEGAREKPTIHFRKNIDKDSYYSLTLNEDNQIVITKSFIDGWAWKWSPFYAGQCKDVNTFRMICKLLNIN